jgi:hypothetical protein
MECVKSSLKLLNELHVSREGAKLMFTYLDKMLEPRAKFNIFPVFHSRIILDVNDIQWFLVFFFDETRLNEDSATWMSAHMLRDMGWEFLAKFRCTNVARDHQMDVSDMTAGAPYPGWNQTRNKLGFMQDIPPPITGVIANGSATRPKNTPKVTSEFCGFKNHGCKQVLSGNGGSSAKLRGHKDHIVALANFGLNEKYNVRMICSLCHEVKSSTEAKHFPRKSSPIDLSFLACQVLVSAALRYSDNREFVEFKKLSNEDEAALLLISMNKEFIPPNVAPMARPKTADTPRGGVRDLSYFLRHFELVFVDHNDKVITRAELRARKDFYDRDGAPKSK